MRIPFTLQDTASPDRTGYNHPSDTLKLKLGLKRLGFYEPQEETFIPAATDDVWSALRDFQRVNKLKVDAVANPDGPTVKAMNAALAQAPARPVIRGRIPAATTDTTFKNGRTVRGMGGYSDSGDYPAFMASALYSKDGSRAASEVADLLKQARAINPKQGDHMRTRLAELLDPEDMDRIEMAAGVAVDERTTPSPKGDGTLISQSGDDKPDGSKDQPGSDVPFEMTPPVPNPIIRDDPQGYGGFGKDRDGGRRKHAGVDLEAPPGASVVSPVDGTVEHIGDVYGDSEYKTIWIRTRDGSRVGMFYVQPADASGKPTVKPGDSVTSGQTIGTMQDIAKRYEAPDKEPMTNHLHLEIRRGEGRGKPVDPSPWLRRWGIRN